MAKKPPRERSRVLLDAEVADELREESERVGLRMTAYLRACFAAYRAVHEGVPLPLAKPAAEPPQASGTVLDLPPPGRTHEDVVKAGREPLIIAVPTLLSRIGHQLRAPMDPASITDDDDQVPTSTEPAPPDLAALSERSQGAREGLQTAVDGLIGTIGTVAETSIDPDVIGAAWDVAASRRGVEVRAEEAMAPALQEIFRVALEDVSHGDVEVALNVVMHWFDVFLDVGEIDPRILRRSIDDYRERLPDPEMPPWTAEAIVTEAMEL